MGFLVFLREWRRAFSAAVTTAAFQIPLLFTIVAQYFQGWMTLS